MHVAFVADLEGLGGAGIAASRLAIGLARAGVRVTRLSNNPSKLPIGEPVTWESRYAGPPRALEVGLNGLRRGLPRLARALGRIDSSRRLRAAIAAEQIDVVHVQGIHAGYWDHAALGSLDPDCPVVWTFHDCWGFSPESYLYRDLEGREQRVKPDGADRGAALERRRRYFASRTRIRLAASSAWVADEARRLLGLEVSVIPYGLDLESFRPIDRRVAREALGIPTDAIVVGFSADVRAEPLKGFEVLRRALERLGDARLFGIALGDGPVGVERIGRTPVRLMGRVVHPTLLAAVYAAADVFVMPSLAEAMGQVAMEAIACGTPVIASAVGGLPEVVAEGESGFLFRAGDDAALAQRLGAIAANPEVAHTLVASCRARAVGRWGLERQARAYLALYGALTDAT